MNLSYGKRRNMPQLFFGLQVRAEAEQEKQVDSKVLFGRRFFTFRSSLLLPAGGYTEKLPDILRQGENRQQVNLKRLVGEG